MRIARVASLVLLSTVCALESRAQWVPMFKIEADYVYSFAVSGTDTYAAAGNGGIFHSSDCGSSWTDITNDLPERYVNTVAASPGNLYAGIYNYGVFRSTNDGLNWTACGDMWIDGGLYNVPRSLAVNDTVVYAGTDYGGVFYSTDYGVNWETVNIDSTRGILRDLLVSDSTILAAVECPGCPGGGVWVSNDHGVTWRSANVGLPFTNLAVNRFAVSGRDLFAAAWTVNTAVTGGVYHSTNGGETWTACSTEGLPTIGVSDLAVSGGQLFASRGSIFASANKGGSWTSFPDGLPYGGGALAVCGEYLLTGGGDQFIYRRPQSELVVSVSGLPNEFPAHFELRQNYPNPFNPSTTIRYGLPSRSHVTLTVFNTLGQQVATLVQSEQEAGFHEAIFDAKNLASGVYLYRLTAGSYVETRKLVFVR